MPCSPAEEDQRAEADPAPDRHDDDGVQRLVRGGEELQRGQADLGQAGVDQPVVGVHQPREDDAGRDRGRDDRDEHGEAVQRHPAEPAVECCGGQQRQHQGDGDEQQRVDHACAGPSPGRSGRARAGGSCADRPRWPASAGRCAGRTRRTPRPRAPGRRAAMSTAAGETIAQPLSASARRPPMLRPGGGAAGRGRIVRGRRAPAREGAVARTQRLAHEPARRCSHLAAPRLQGVGGLRLSEQHRLDHLADRGRHLRIARDVGSDVLDVVEVGDEHLLRRVLGAGRSGSPGSSVSDLRTGRSPVAMANSRCTLAEVSQVMKSSAGLGPRVASGRRACRGRVRRSSRGCPGSRAGRSRRSARRC